MLGFLERTFVVAIVVVVLIAVVVRRVVARQVVGLAGLLELAKGIVVGDRLLFELRRSVGTLLCRWLGLVVDRLGCLSGFVWVFGDARVWLSRRE